MSAHGARRFVYLCSKKASLLEVRFVLGVWLIAMSDGESIASPRKSLRAGVNGLSVVVAIPVSFRGFHKKVEGEWGTSIVLE